MPDLVKLEMDSSLLRPEEEEEAEERNWSVFANMDSDWHDGKNPSMVAANLPSPLQTPNKEENNKQHEYQQICAEASEAKAVASRCYVEEWQNPRNRSVFCSKTEFAVL